MNLFTIDLLSLFGVALGLSMDAFAVSVANGFLIKQVNFRHILRIALFFGGFQAIMPLLGWSTGHFFSSFFSKINYWIASGLLFLIGIKMIIEARKIESNFKDATHLPTLILLSIATSIDALAVGFSFAMLHLHIIEPAVIIGGITFIVSFLGVYLGNRIGHLFERKLDIIGGIVLIIIGIKILFENILK